MCLAVKGVVNHMNSFSVIIQPLIRDILDKEKVVEEYVGVTTMGLSSSFDLSVTRSNV